jgi:heptose I phosphotransferase
MHTHGMNHRDYYICHFLLDISGGRDRVDPETLKASLIDLHRAQIRKKTPRRWIVKDVAGLYFSAMDMGLTQRDLFRFARVYLDKPLRETFAADSRFWSAVNQTAERLYAKEKRKPGG